MATYSWQYTITDSAPDQTRAKARRAQRRARNLAAKRSR